MQDYKKLDVWRKGHQLVLSVYQLTKSFPQEELYGLTRQLRRAAVSVPANIVEGTGRLGNSEFRHYLNIAMGSLCEVEYFIILAQDLHYLGDSQQDALSKQVTELKRMLASLQNKVKESLRKPDTANSKP